MTISLIWLLFSLFQAVLDEVFDEVPIFHNLRNLSLNSCFINTTKSGVCQLKALGRFLHKSPNLEELTLKSFKVVLNFYLHYSYVAPVGLHNLVFTVKSN